MSHETEYLEDQDPVNLIQYNGRDFPTIFDSLLRRLREEYGDVYDDFGSTSVGIMLVHLFAYGMSQNAWYMDRRASDAFMTTARSRGAVARLTRGLGYKMSPATASSTDMELVFDDPLTGNGIIQEGFRFEGADDLVFSTGVATNVSIGDTGVTVSVSEGENRELAFTSNGEPWQEFELSGANDEDGIWVASLSPRIFVNGVEWEEKDFLTLDKTDHFEVAYNEDPVVVRFGDNISGNIPVVGSDIVIKYKIINGASGNVNSDTILSNIDELVVLGSPVAMTVTNPENSTGGRDPADYKRAQQLAPLYYASRGAVITSPDYFAHVNSFSDPIYGSVAKGYGAVVRSSSNDITTNTYASQLSNYIDEMISQVNTANSDVISSHTVINEAVTDITASNTLLSELNTENNDTNDTNEALLTEVIGSSGVITSNCSTISAQLLELSTLVNTSDSTTVQKVAMLTLINEIKANNSSSLSAGNGISGNMGLAKSGTINIGVNIDAIHAESGKIFVSNLIIFTESNKLEGYMNSLVYRTNSIKNQFDAELAEFMNYLSTLFDSDCKANIVNVPILTTDASGFYASPSTGLINALQVYLDGICEVTQYIKVVSGYSNLVYAEITAEAVGLSTIVKSELKEKLTQILEGVIKGKDFGENLYLSELYDAVKPIIGKDHINILITSPSSNLDSYGNLITKELQIVTKGNVIVNVN